MPFFPASQFFGFFPNLDTNKFTTPYIETLITLVTTEFDLQTKNIFAPTFTNVTEADCFNFFNRQSINSNFIYIIAWQKAGLQVKKISVLDADNPTPTGTLLTLGKDYYLWFGCDGYPTPGFTLPVTHLKLNFGLSKNECLRVWGSYGWANSYPIDVKLSLCQLTLKIAQANFALADEKDQVVMEKSITTEVRYKDTVQVFLQNYFNSNEFLALKKKYFFDDSQISVL